VLEVLADEPERLVVKVADTRPVVRCAHCGFKTASVHDRRTKTIGDLPVSGRPTTLRWERRRFGCANCDQRFMEDHPEFEGDVTRRLARQLVADAKAMSIREVARRHRLSWHHIMGLVALWATLVVEHRRRQRCRVLLVDETSLRRGHRYVTVLQDGESGAMLGMVRHCDEAALSSFVAAQGHRWCRQSREVVVSDGSKSYKAAIDRHAGHSTHVLDQFHVVRWFAVGLIEVRRRIQRREPRGTVTPAFVPEVFRARFILLARADHLDDARHERLERLLAQHRELEIHGGCSKSSTASTSPTTSMASTQHSNASCSWRTIEARGVSVLR
jgi:transposase